MRKKTIGDTKNFGDHQDEGRAIILEYEKFYLITVYVPNAQDQLKRIDYRMKWEEDFLAFIKELDDKKPVIICGDMNVAKEEIDLKNPKTNRNNAGFSDQERDKMRKLLDAGFVDTFRYLYPDATGIYSWWSYRFNARKNNAGVAYRLFYRQRTSERQDCRCQNSYGYYGQRPLPGGTGNKFIIEKR